MDIFTSIAPRDVEKQSYATRTWVDHGFKAISLNTREEIEFLAPRFGHVEFQEVERNAMEAVGKPFIFVDDLFAAVAASAGPVSGIVNSDIILASKVNLPALMANEAASGVVYGSRLDVPDRSTSRGTMYEVGFDYFFMDRETARCYPETMLCMGAPMWDYWAVLMPILRNRQCKFLNAIVARHVKHDQTWDNRINIRMMAEIIEKSGIEFEGLEGVQLHTFNAISGQVLNEFAQFILGFLSQHSTPVFRVLHEQVGTSPIRLSS